VTIDRTAPPSGGAAGRAHVPAVDRRVQRSRRRLHAALVDEILERGWDRVSVRAVCARAGVGRSTFYEHFADKEDALVGGLDHVRDELRAAADPRAPFGFVGGMIDHVGGSRRLFRAVIGKRSGLAVQRRFREVIRELMLDTLRGRVPARQLEARARFLGGALVELLIWWADDRSGLTAGELAREFERLAAPIAR
jgi:AcrR family transcriptional regulator